MNHLSFFISKSLGDLYLNNKFQYIAYIATTSRTTIIKKVQHICTSMYNLFYRIYINYIVKWLSVSSSRFRLHFDLSIISVQTKLRKTIRSASINRSNAFFLCAKTIIPIASSKIEFALLYYLTNCQNFR